jgi:hypothetical protein
VHADNLKRDSNYQLVTMESGETTALLLLHVTLRVAKHTDNCCPALQTDVCVVIDVLIGVHLISLAEEYPAKKGGIAIMFCRKGRFVRI